MNSGRVDDMSATRSPARTAPSASLRQAADQGVQAGPAVLLLLEDEDHHGEAPASSVEAKFSSS